MNELDAIQLEGREFVIIDEIVLNGVKYIHLANASDIEDFCIRKIVLRDNKEILTGLDTIEEFDFVLDAFIKKNKTEDN